MENGNKLRLLYIHVVHILDENTYFNIVGKGIADLIEGRVITADVLCS